MTTIIASHLLPDTAVSCSPSSLILNQNNQFIILTRSILYIYTPSLGIQIDAISLQQAEDKSAVAKNKPKTSKPNLLPMFSTTIAIDKKNLVVWADFSDDPRTLTPGQQEAFWRSACWSPSGIATLGGCILATLTTNAQVLLYEPSNNAHKGAWVEVSDLTSTLVRKLIPGDAHDAAALVLACQATCISWSPYVTSVVGDWSILAVGHKSGHVSLWRYCGEGKLVLLHRSRVSEEAAWIGNIAWSSWSVSALDSDLVISHLSVSDSNGLVWILDVAQPCTASARESQEAVDEAGDEADGMEIEISEASAVRMSEAVEVGEADRRIVTQLEWIERDTSAMILVYTRLGTVNFAMFSVSETDSTLELSEETELEFDIVGGERWVGATSLAICSGIEYFAESQLLLITLLSGAFYTISLFPTPSFIIEDVNDALPTSSDVTAVARKCFAKVGRVTEGDRLLSTEAGSIKVQVTKFDGMEIKGMTAFGPNGEIGWIYATSSPDTLTYYPSVKMMFILAPILELNFELSLTQLSALFQSPPSSFHENSISTLRSFLLLIKHHLADINFINELLKLLSLTPKRNRPPRVAPIQDLEELRRAFKTHLVDDKLLGSLRLKESVARFIIRDQRLAEECFESARLVYATLARRLACEVTARLGPILHASSSLLHTDEKPLSGRMTIACASLQEDPRSKDLASIDYPETFLGAGGDESCLACRSRIEFSDARRARCTKGHEWERCSITLSVVATVKVRTCISCERKALASIPSLAAEEADDESEEKETETGVVNALLKASTCCLYCGGSWSVL